MRKKSKNNRNFFQRAINTFLMFLFVIISFALWFKFSTAASYPEVPTIISRSEWGADESKMTWPVEYKRVEKFVVHHTASTNLIPDADGSGEYKNMVKNIYNYHKNRKTWYDDDEEYVGYGDIGYNYLIDPNGNIYEGRYGGNGSVAGHVRGFNEGSVGISVLGRYQDYTNSKGIKILSHPVTAAIKKSIENLIGWLSANNNVDLNKISNFHGKNIDGVVGHRDLSLTVCPGDELYKQLDEIQKNASNYASAYKNYAYQISGDKAIYIIENGYKTKFNSFHELPAEYKSRIVKLVSKTQLDMYKYKNNVMYLDGSLIKEFDSPTVYYLENGLKRAMSMTGEEFEKMGFNENEVKNVFSSDLKLYNDGKIIKYAPERLLIKDSNNNIYLTENGKKRKFTSPRLFEYLGYEWKNVKSDSNIDFYIDGDDMLYPNGTIISERNGGIMYIIEDFQKKEISSYNLLEVLGYKKDDVVFATKDELDHFPLGDRKVYPDNTLIKAKKTPTVYLVENGKLKEFTSAVLFEKLGYKWNNIINADNDEIAMYAKNGKVLYPDGTLIRANNSPNVYFLENGLKRKITSIDFFEKLGYKWKDVFLIGIEEMKDYKEGKVMVYPSGTLIKRSDYPSIYKVEDNGKIKEFTSATLFEAENNNWNDVIIIKDEEFSYYVYDGQVRYKPKTLLRKKGGNKVYLVKDNGIEWIKTKNEFDNLGFKWSNIIDVSPAELALYLIGDAKTANDNIDASDGYNSNNKSDYKKNNPNIRVAIYYAEKEDVAVTADGKYSVTYYNSDNTVKKTERKQANVKTVVPYFESSSYIVFAPSDKNTILQVVSYNDKHNPLWDKNIKDEKLRGNDNRFRGKIEIRYSNVSKKLWVINELPIEDYVKGIAEALPNSPEEYLKMFSVVARTYALYYIDNGGKYYGEKFHLKNSRNGNGNDQIYKGYNFEIRAPNISKIDDATSGYVIVYNKKPIVAAYSSDSGGVTKDGCKILSKLYCSDEYIYIRGGVADPPETEHSENKIAESHGVGMSAVGAYQMAVNGKKWDDIIKHYYGKEVEIKKLW